MDIIYIDMIRKVKSGKRYFIMKVTIMIRKQIRSTL